MVYEAWLQGAPRTEKLQLTREEILALASEAGVVRGGRGEEGREAKSHAQSARPFDQYSNAAAPQPRSRAQARRKPLDTTAACTASSTLGLE